MLGILGLLVIGLLDWSVKTELGFSVFYLFPIVLITWYGGRRGGDIACVVAAMIWLWAELYDFDQDGLIVSVWNMLIRLTTFILMTRLLVAIKSAYQREYFRARIDALTGALNWRCFQEILSSELERRSRYRYPLSLAYLDIDNFKQVNDTFGHAEGDRLLKEVSLLIRQTVRNLDQVARLGGDEFVVLMPHTNQAEAQQVIDRLQHELLSTARNQDLNIGFSIGVMTFEDTFPQAEEVLIAADELMYRAQAEGKNRIYYSNC